MDMNEYKGQQDPNYEALARGILQEARPSLMFAQDLHFSNSSQERQG